MSRNAILAAGAIACLGLADPAVLAPSPRLLWNASASAPIGLYHVSPLGRPARGILIAIRPPASAARLADDRHYLPLGHPLIKWIAAVDGDFVCRTGTTIRVGGRAIGEARLRDHLGRPLPRWQGCAWLGPGDVFVMNTNVPDSFDGRYFGISSVASILGRVTPLWLRDAHPVPRSPTREGPAS